MIAYENNLKSKNLYSVQLLCVVGIIVFFTTETYYDHPLGTTLTYAGDDERHQVEMQFILSYCGSSSIV